MNVICDYPTRITYYDLDARGRLKLSALLRLAHIAADINATCLGCGYAQLAPLEMGFVLQRFGLAASRMPRYDEAVTVRTWPGDIARGIFSRHGDMLDGAGERIMEWTSLWVLLDLRARRILRPGALPVGFSGCGRLGVTVDADRLAVPDARPCSAHTHTVRFSETDTYGHMNNTFYGDMVADALAGEADAPQTFAAVQINYLAEARLGETLDVQCARLPGAEAAEQTASGAAQSDWYVTGRIAAGRVIFTARVRGLPDR